MLWAQGSGMTPSAWMKMQDKVSPIQDYSVTMVVDASGQAMSIKMYKLGKKVRSDIAMQGMQMSSIVDPEADEGKGVSYTLMHAMKSYIKSSPLVADAAQAAADADKADVKIEELGKEDVDGAPCDKRRVTSIVDGRSQTFLVWTSPKVKDMPVKLAMTEPAAATILFKDYNFEKPSADLFKVPADYKGNDLGQMMQAPPRGAVTPPPPPPAGTTVREAARDTANEAANEAAKEGINRAIRKIF